MKHITRVITALILAVVFSVSIIAHGGGIDKNGGHKDNKNKSGLGSYHYHCGGNPPHLHNGGCPYASEKKITKPAPTKKTEKTVKPVKKTKSTKSKKTAKK